MVHATRLAMVSLALGACVSEYPAEDDSLLHFRGALDPQGSQLEGPLMPAVVFTTDSGNALRVVDGRTQGSFPTSFSFELEEPPPSDLLYTLEDGEPPLAFGYITAVAADHPTSVLVANSETELDGCAGAVCTSEHTWCSQDNDPRQDVCYTETSTCDANRQNCTLVAEGDASLKSGPWSALAGVSQNLLVLYLSAPAAAGTITSLAFAEGKPLAAGYHLLAGRVRSEAEQDEASACFERSEQAALERYNQQHGTTIDNAIDLPSEGGDEFDRYFFDAQRELRCPQTDKAYTPVDDERALSIRLSRSEDALWL
jgi:hypothetical protein